MILKVLLVALVIGIVYFIVIKKKPIQNKKNTPKNTKRENHESNDMVSCSTCGTYAELSETIISNNKYYCSDECLGKA